METIINTRTKYCLRKLKEGNKVQLPFHNDITPKRTDETRMKESKSLFKNYSPDNFWVKLLFLISAVSLTFLLSIAPSSIYSYIFLIPSVILGLIIWLYLVFKKNLLQKIWKKTSGWIRGLSLILSCGTLWMFCEGLFKDAIKFITDSLTPLYNTITQTLCNSDFLNTHGGFAKAFNIIEKCYINSDILIIISIICLCFLSIYSLYLIWKFLLTIILPEIRLFYFSLDKIERWYLLILSICAIVLVPILYLISTVFYCPTEAITLRHLSSVLFGWDTMEAYDGNSFGYINTGLSNVKHLAFGIFSQPFSLIAFIISKILFFIPNIYAAILGILQVIAASIITILLSRLVKASGFIKLGFIILGTVAYSVILPSIVLEQYVFATFWLILFIYSVCTSKKYQDWLFIGSVSTLTTSVILFPLLSNKLNFKKYLSVFIKALILWILCGRLYLLGSAIPQDTISNNL